MLYYPSDSILTTVEFLKKNLPVNNNLSTEALFCISELLMYKGIMGDVSLSDIKEATSNTDYCTMGTGFSYGKGRSYRATEIALNAPGFNLEALSTVKGIIVSIVASLDLERFECEEIEKRIKEFSNFNAKIIIGNVINIEVKNILQVTIIASGCFPT